MQLDLTKEISILQVNYYHQLELLGATFAGWKRDSTFRPTNWILAFPYNFVSLKENVSMTLIREIALCNALYGTHIFKEDKVLDNYNLPEAEYRSCILDMCRTQLLKNLGLAQFVRIGGESFLAYFSELESRYYSALIREKQMDGIGVDEMLADTNLTLLGDKSLPLVVSSVAFCLHENIEPMIPLCERLVTNYHIAHQLFDDYNDLEDDIKKADLSYMLNACKQSLKKAAISIGEARDLLGANNYRQKTRIFEAIERYLAIAEMNAQELHFEIFMNQIHRLRHAASSCTR